MKTNKIIKIALGIVLIILIIITAIYYFDDSRIVNGNPIYVGNSSMDSPYGFYKINGKDPGAIDLIDTKEVRIHVKTVNGMNSSVAQQSRIDSVNKKSEQTLLESHTSNVNNITTYYLTFRFTNIKGLNNLTACYFTFKDKTFNIDVWNFNYDNEYNKTIDDINSMVKSIK